MHQYAMNKKKSCLPSDPILKHMDSPDMICTKSDIPNSRIKVLKNLIKFRFSRKTYSIGNNNHDQ